MKAKQIEAFERITLRENGMRGSIEYEITSDGSTAEVVQYGIRFRYPDDERIAERQATVSIDEVLALLNSCRLLSWDGFHGAHPRGVRDGIMFSLQAVVNGGTVIKAEGSQNFPKHYSDFRDGIYEMLK